jgi:uncharacterized protein
MSAPLQSGTDRKRCTVAYATPARQFLWQVELPTAATIGEALQAARERAIAESALCAAIPWETAAVGVFGELRSRSDPCADGDRIELYRPLSGDPRARRREQVRRGRRSARAGGR